MKKKYLFIFCLVAFKLVGQDSSKVLNDSLGINKQVKTPKREISLDILNFLITDKRLNFGYEHYLKNKQSFFCSITLKEKTGLLNADFSNYKSVGIIAAYQAYFSKKTHEGFFFSPFFRYRNTANFEFDMIPEARDRLSYLGYGMKVGVKLINGRLTCSPQISVSRNIFRDSKNRPESITFENMNQGFYYEYIREPAIDFHIYLGYRF